MQSEKDPNVLATIHVATGRIYLAIAVQIALGVLLIGLAFTTQTEAFGKLLLSGFGVIILYQGMRMRGSIGQEIILSGDGIVTADGLVLAEMAQISGVSRGPFAFKPSNGLAVTLKTRHKRLWRPGLWWRFGRRLGIGGVTSAGAAKFMAEQLALELEHRPKG